MLTFISGDLFESQADAYVCTVNCMGFMGKGIALHFKRKFPGLCEAYAKECQAGRMQPGTVWPWITGRIQPRIVFNFPTKLDWRNSSQLIWIEAGLSDLAIKLDSMNVESVAIPALGCQNGGLAWTDVVPLFTPLANHSTDITVYRPQ